MVLRFNFFPKTKTSFWPFWAICHRGVVGHRTVVRVVGLALGLGTDLPPFVRGSVKRQQIHTYISHIDLGPMAVEYYRALRIDLTMSNPSAPSSPPLKE